MTVKQRIIAYLQNHPEGIDDDELAKVLNLSARQQANNICRQLEKDGLVSRKQVNGKIQNFWANKTTKVSPNIAQESKPDIPKFENWFWEGNIQAKVIEYLVSQNCHIRSVADTATRQQGIDIIAEKNGKKLCVSVKGFPNATPRTNPSVQAGHWFKQAIFDMIDYRERDKNVMLALALPDFPRYRKMAAKITWF